VRRAKVEEREEGRRREEEVEIREDGCKEIVEGEANRRVCWTKGRINVFILARVLKRRREERGKKKKEKE
jgi:hypothetical protein